jgi:hypothetical protein
VGNSLGGTLATIDPEKVRQLQLLSGGITPSVPPPSGVGATAGLHPLAKIGVTNAATAPTLEGGPVIAPPVQESSPALPSLNFKQRQAMPLTSPGVAPGSSGYYQNKLSRIEDQEANPLGSAENHPGVLGKIGHVLGTIGNKALDVTGINTIPGTEANREARKAWDQSEIGKAQTLESEDAARKATAAYQQGELGQRGRESDLAERKEKFEEGKPGTPEQESIKDLTSQKNPATGKNYTAEEAEVKRAQDIQDTKPDKEAGAPKTVTMLDKPGGKPFEYQYDPKGNYSGDQGYGQWKKVGPAQPNAMSLGLAGTLTPLLGPNGEIMGTMNNKTGAIAPVSSNPLTPGGATTSAGARLGNTERNQFNTQYIKPATDIETNYQKAQAAMTAYNNNPQTGAAGMIELSQHIATTLGGVKGVSTGENMIHEHENAIGLSDKIDRYLDYLKTGQPLSANQMRDFNQLITETRDITWTVAAKEAARRHQPIDFLPSDVQIGMKDSSGKVRHVPGSKVQSALDAGAELAE